MESDNFQKPCAEDIDLSAPASSQDKSSNQIMSLPACLPAGAARMLSPEARKKVGQLSRPDPLRFALEIIKTWLIVAVAISIAVYFNDFFVSCLVILVIAGRQLELGYLMHEQCHYLGIKSRWGDLLTNLFVCYPLLVVSVLGYARVHLTHHKFYLTGKDPDLVRKSGKDWTFPMPLSHLLILFFKDLIGLNLIQTILGKNKKEGTLDIKRLGPHHEWVRFVYFALWATFFTLTHSWHIFLLYWLLPLLTVLQVFLRFAAICEHVYIENSPIETSTAVIRPAWWETMIFPHFNFFYHPYHHYFPGVPFHRLPEIHKLFVKEGLVKEECVFNSFTQYIKFIMSKNRSEPAVPA